MKRIRLNAIQYKFWMDDQLKSSSVEFNDPNYTFEIRGNLHLDCLRKAYRQIMLEYPPFSSLIELDGEGYPYFVHDETNVDFPFTYVDLSFGNLYEVESKILDFINTPFDLKKEFPCNFLVIRFAERWFLVHSCHHIIIDVMSQKLFFKRLSEIYNQLLEKDDSFKSQLDSLLYFNQCFEKEYNLSKAEHIDYWRNYVKGVPLQLPIPKIAAENTGEVSFPFTLGEALRERCVQFCDEQQTTLFRLYASLWALTLSKLTGVDSLLLDHAVNMRPRGDEFLLGVFVNNYPMKFIFNEDDITFVDIIHNVNEDRKKEREHLYVFYSDVFNQQNQEAEFIHGINVGINYPMECKRMRLDFKDCESIPYKTMGHIDLEISTDLLLVIEKDDQLTCHIRYRSNISSDFVKTLSCVYKTILEQVLQNPFVKLKDLSLLALDKQKELLKLEDISLKKAEKANTFLNCFHHVVKEFPDNVAVRYERSEITYAELDQQSDNVANFLKYRGLFHQRIGLSTPKNLQMIIGILGILKSENTYVPLDYTFPKERLDFMIQDSDVKLILLTEETPIFFEKYPIAFLEEVCVNGDLSSCKGNEVSLSSEAYIIYTSGTTGKPKGIPICHSVMYQTIITNVKIQELKVHSKVMQFTNICFDASIVEIFPILTVGGTLVLPKDEIRKDLSLLLSFLRDEQITSLVIPAVLLANLPHESLPSVRTIVIGGDTTSPEAIDYWSKEHILINAYGPTENTVDATYSIMTPDSPINDIGSSLPGVTCYVVDKDMHLMPDYTIGELCIGGVKLTNGYINRPELNAEKFVSNPFVSEEDKKEGKNLRLYKTGDLVMRRKDGHLIFYGRSDFQVKLHGYRIELGDIEFKIREYSSIVKNVVVIISGVNEHKKLIAYIHTAEPSAFSVKELRDFLSGTLPVYMVPAKFIVLDEFPYNTSGKVDRKKLPDPASFLEEKRVIDLPVTLTELKLADLWKFFLPTDQIGLDDDFLLLGGDSMGIIQLSFKIEESFDIAIRASDIYKYTTLRTLAEFIDNQLNLKDQKTEDADSCKGVCEIPLSPVQYALWLQCVRSESIKDIYNLPCIFECPENIQYETLEEAFNHLVRLQEGFRMSFPINDEGKPYIRISEYSPIKIDIKQIKSQDLFEELSQDMKISFDLEKGPLFTCKLYVVDGCKPYVSLVMHHLISDGWSADLIRTVLLNSVTGKDVNWDDLTGSYVDYVDDVKRFMKTEAFGHRLKYWESQLKNISDLEILKSKQSQELDTSGGTFTIPFPKELNKTVESFCSDRVFTPFGVYISIYLLLLSRISKQSDFVVGFPYLGRERGKYNHVVGYFVHTLPLCYKKAYNDYSFLKYIEAIHRSLLEVRENSVPLEELVKIARTQSDDPNLDFLQTMFVFNEKLMISDHIKKENSAFGLVLSILFDNDQFSCQIEYQEKIFSRSEVQMLASAYMTLLSSAVQNPTKRLGEYSLASEEYVDSVISSNNCLESMPKDITLFLERFSFVAKSNPDKEAIVYKEEKTTYKELDTLSDEVALHIKSLGISSSVNIAVNMVASVKFVATVIGVWKAGCCYVPIAMDIPEERRNLMIEDASCIALFNEQNYPYGSLVKRNKDCIHDDEAAYIIYTSGTTGKPKGVPVSQMSLAYLVNSILGKSRMTESSRVLLFANIGFDASITEIFPTLSIGATLIIASPEERINPVLLADLIERQSVSYLELSAPVLPLLPKREYPLLSTIIVGGESLPISVLHSWAENRFLFNAYGPTENAVDTTMCLVDESFEMNDIGLPLPGVTCYVLDENQHIVPADMEGELYIGGIQLTRGYLNRDELNKEKFIENPYVLDTDKENGLNLKLYKTGDKVKRRSDGHLIFCGRADRQVKFHGFRIEYADIEQHLLDCEHVQQVLVEVQHKNDQEDLVAYIQSEEEIDLRILQDTLKKKLPIYMVPTKWAVVSHFPLTKNGKTDRKRLPEPKMLVKEKIVPPRNEDEKVLLSLLCDFMGTSDIGVETDLLDAGMTSMQIMEFVGYVSEHSDFRVTISSLYKNRTIRKLLEDCSGKLYFWVNEYTEEKPTIVLICGFPYLHPFYDELIQYFETKFNIFVMESFNEFFHAKEDVSIDQLLDFYVNVFRSKLSDKLIYAVTGFCTGAEIAVRLASRLKEEKITDLNVLMLEGVYKRGKSGSVSFFIEDESIQEHYTIAGKLLNSFDPINYEGNIIIALAEKTSNRIWLNGGEETDECLLNKIHHGHDENIKLWKQAYPNAPFYLLDTDHWTFLEKKNLDVLWEAMQTYWKM